MSEPTTPNEREEAYDLIDRFLRNNLDDTDYADFSQALDLLFVAQRTEPAAPVASTAAVPEGAEAVAWLYELQTDGHTINKFASDDRQNYPFGIGGRDYACGAKVVETPLIANPRRGGGA